ncbi:hypothetical protein [Methanosaeta sp. UBA356]|jgi:hypothetical protein|uniref:hypothetical protein n=1 Tax=Methanosaeta sp. UBA356 TaxID=1915559 RepID=UPI002579CDF7|nr:hypothetical protein [Methanosaeta sp. UBA356]
MAYTATVAAIKAEIETQIDALVTINSGTPLVKELEAALDRAVAALIAAGTIEQTSRVEDA